MKELSKKIEQCFTNKNWRMNNLYYIVNEEGETILFKPNAIQKSIIKNASDNRDVILKYRQGGVSTYYIILLLDEVLFGGTNVNNIFITHRQDLLKVFFDKARFAYDSIPEEYKAFLPIPSTDNANELVFMNSQSGKMLNNRLKISLDVRGQTPSRLHISEFAFMEEKKQRELKLAIDQFRKTKITIESTANGIGNAYYKIVMTAKSLNGTYKLLFYPWFIEERNKSQLLPGEELLLDENEKILKENYELTDEQLKWRRQKIHDANALGEQGEKLFDQENPTTIESAFITSGNTVFDTSMQYDIIRPYREIEGWKFFQPPQDQLIIGIDMAEGGVKGDFSCMSVRNANKELVAIYKAKANEVILAEKLDFFFNIKEKEKYYLGSVLPENNVGLAFINECKKYNWFTERMLLSRQNDKTYGEDDQIQKYGFTTTSKSKNLIIREYRGLLYKRELSVSKDIYSEILTFVFDKNNKPNAIAPNHDDLLMADMIAVHGVVNETNLLTYDEEKKQDISYSAFDLKIKDVNRFEKNDLNTGKDLFDGYTREDIL